MDVEPLTRNPPRKHGINNNDTGASTSGTLRYVAVAAPTVATTFVNQEYTLTQTVASTCTHMVQYVAVTAPSSTIGGLNNEEYHSAAPINNDVSAVHVNNDVSAVPVDNDVSANSFSFPLQNVTDEIPQGRLPQVVSYVLELFKVAHNDVHSHGVEQKQQDSQTVQALKISVAAALLPLSVEHVDVHESFEIHLSSSGTVKSPAQHKNTDSEAHNTSPAGLAASSAGVVSAADDQEQPSVQHQLVDSHTIQHVQGTNIPSNSYSDIPVDNGTHKESMVDQHSNPVIQQDIDLWNRIQEYDQCSAAKPFTTVLSKKQKKQLKQQVLGVDVETIKDQLEVADFAWPLPETKRMSSRRHN